MTHLLHTEPIEAVMPTVEMDPPTTPIHLRPDVKCGWCHIPLSALPDLPKPFQPRDSPFILYYHPTGCISAARNQDAGIRRM